VPRILVIPLGDSPVPGWAFRDFTVEQVEREADGVRCLRDKAYEAVIVVARNGTQGLGELCTSLDDACGFDVVPLVLAADAGDARAVESLDSSSFDAFLDLAWEPALVERCLSLAITRVRAGRGVAAIQHQVLRVVGDEVEALKDLSVRDGTTGLYNARHFREVLAREHERCLRYDLGYAVAFFDVDNLRDLNNTHGHEVGTRALIWVANALVAVTRQSDFAFRVGGDEFVSLLAECSREAAARYADRICGALRQCHIAERESPIRVSISAGVAVYPDDGDSADAVLRAADAALYEAKTTGRDRVVVYRTSAQPRSQS